MSLTAAQHGLVSAVTRLVPNLRGGVKPGPGAWSEAYFERLVAECPAVRIAWLRGVSMEPHASVLDLDTQWGIVAIARWDGRDRAGAGDDSAAWVEAIAAALHGYTLTATDLGDRAAAADALGPAYVLEAERIWSGAIDKKGVAIAAAIVGMQVSVDPDYADLGALAQIDVDWNLVEGARDAGLPTDAEQTIRLEDC